MNGGPYHPWFLFVHKIVVFCVVFVMVFGPVETLLEKTFRLSASWLPSIGAVLAAPGDFSIFRNANDNTLIPASNAEVDVVWDTIVTENAQIELQTGSSTIELLEGGKYLVLYNVWADASSGGSNRRSVETYLTLDGVRQNYGHGDGYIRDSGGDDEFAYAAGAAIIDASANDLLEVNIARDDSNTDEFTRIRTGTNGISIIKMRDDFDYLRVHNAVRDEDISANDTFTDIEWDTSTEVDTGSFGFTAASGDITIKGALGDYFLVTTNVRLEQDEASGNRTNYEMRLTIDGTEIAGTRSNAYVRGDPNSNGIYNGTLVYTGLIQKSSALDETLSVEVRRETPTVAGTPVVDVMAVDTGLAIAKLPSSAHYVSLTSATDQSLTGALTPVDFDNQLDIESEAFSHSEVTNPSRINIDKDGDYLFFSNVYTTRTTNGDRDPVRVEWRLDGTTVVPYGGHGSFNRGDQGDFDAFTSGSAGGLILNGLLDTQYVEVTAYDEEDAGNSTIPIAGTAVQGVELSLLFQTDVDVYTAGSMQSSLSYPLIDQYAGGTFVVQENSTSRNLTTVTITESGTVDASTALDNIKLFYELDTSSPYNCASESYGGTESQYGSTDTNGFSGSNGVVSFADSVGISPTATFCGYVVYDIAQNANDADTISLEIANPVTDVVGTGGPIIGPSTAVALNGSTILQNAEITQIHYHWRNDDGSEAAATSVDGAEDTPAGGFTAGTQRRLRVALSAEGSANASAGQFRLQYAEKAGTCEAATGWEDVATEGGAWDVGDSPHVAFGDNTTNIGSAALGAMSDEESTFDGGGAVVDGGDKSVAITLANDEFTEIEYTLVTTATASEGTTYCFRLVDETPDVTHAYRLPIVIQSSEVDSTLTDFPVYLDLADLGDHFFDNVTTDGGDIRLTTSDGATEVPREVVAINTGSKSGEVHFLAPSISASSDTTFYLYYGASGEDEYEAPSTYGGNKVWSPRYSGVYHLEESGSSYADSSGVSADGVGEVNDPSDTVGQLGRGEDFAANGRIDLGNTMNASLISAGEYYISTWLNLDSSAADQSPVSQYEGPGDFLLWADTGGTGTGFCHYNGTYMPSDCQDLNNQSVGSWQYIAAYHNGTSGGVYLDGLETGSGPFASTFGIDASLRFAIGSTDGDDTDRYFNGQIDEVRISPVNLGLDWSAAEYSNQNNPTGFYSTSTFETLSVLPVAITHNVYPEANITADILVSAAGAHTSSVDAGATNQYVGGTFVIERQGGNRTLTDITISEIGTIDASSTLSNVRLYYDLDVSNPYECTSESYGGGESSVTGTQFSGPNGTTTFNFGAGVTLSSTQTFCGYIVVDVDSGASDGETMAFEILDPSTDVVVSASTVGPSSPVGPTSSTTIAAAILTQTGFHWRNDDGIETAASSATGGTEATPLLQVPVGVPYRLRLLVDNAGTVNSQSTQFQLQYATKVTTCELATGWQRVDGSSAFEMATTSQLVDGNNTSDVLVANGGVTNPVGQTFLTPNGGQKEDDDTATGLTIASNQFAELEYAVAVTEQAGYDTTYCFRLSDNGDVLPVYTAYGELETREKQDFFVQRGTEVISGTSLTLTAGSDYTAPADNTSAFVRITNSKHTGAGNTTGGGNQNADDVTVYVSDQSDLENSFTFTRPATAAGNTRVSWEIVEFIGVAGTDNEMVVREVGVFSTTAGVFNANTSAVSEVVDGDDVVVYITGQYNNDTAANNFNDGLYQASYATSTDIATFTRGDADSVAGGSYAIVEYTGANWQVQRVAHSYTAAGTTETETITAIPGVSSGFIHAQKSVGESLTGLDEAGHQVWLSSLGAVSFQLRSGANTPSNHTSVAWVVANTQTGTGRMTVHQSSGSLSAGGPEPNSVPLNIGATVNTSNSSLFANNDSAGAGTAFPRGFYGYTIISDSTYQLWQSDTGQPTDYRVEVVEWPVADTALRQNYYRWYVDNDYLTPTDAWPVGVADLPENAAMTGTDDPIGDGEIARLRMSVEVSNATLAESVESFKLQYAVLTTTCSAVSAWTDVGAAGSGAVWRGANQVPSDGTTLPSTLLTVSDVRGTYEEENNSVVNPSLVDINEDVEYDWVIQHNGAAQRTNYCFRMVKSDDTALAGYYHYPTLRTTGYTPVVNDWRWYEDEQNETPLSALAGENSTPSNIAIDEPLALRVNVAEVENAQNTNTKFYLQYSEYPDFVDGGTTLTATSSCNEASFWCYADGGVGDNDTVTTALLTTSDACASGVGTGCGNHNEAATTTGSTVTHGALAVTEFSYHLVHTSARANAVYYFRLVDAATEEPLVASSSFPSVLTEGAATTLVSDPVTSGNTTDGHTSDVDTTATVVSYGSVPLDNEYVAIQRFTIDINATEGYRVYALTDQPLTSSNGETINDVSATNLSPAAWDTACASPTTGCFGYHTSDDVLSDEFASEVRFGADDTFAAFSTSPEEVFYSTVPGADVHDIVYKLQVGELQPAGEYVTNITYIIVPVF